MENYRLDFDPDMNILPSTYFPSRAENRMRSEGDLYRARQQFLEYRPSNLEALLTARYSWMNQYLKGKENVVEVGAGAGFSRFFLQCPGLKLTDYAHHPWVDERVDALATPYPDESIDVVISSHMIHHLANPQLFFCEMCRILKPGGFLLIQEINTSLAMRLLLRLMRHEGWSYDVNVFDDQVIANDPRDPWSANCAIPQMLFGKSSEFEKRVPGFKIERNDLGECLLFPLSGGVIAKTRTINLPRPMLRFIRKIDKALVLIAPSIFALGRSVALRKKVAEREPAAAKTCP